MSNYCRAVVPGGVFFFTVATYERAPIFTTEARVKMLREAFRKVKKNRPFVIDAMVVLPDHLHCIWHMPEGDSDYSGRWREIKKSASRAISPRSDGRRERGVWQRRFWEHAIRDPQDWRRHVEYIHYNPVKHGLVAHPRDWLWSSFEHYVARGWHDASWGETEPADIHGLDLE